MKRKAKTIRFTPEEIKLIDKKKGDKSYQSYVVGLVKKDLGISENSQTSLFSNEPVRQYQNQEKYIKYGKKYLAHIKRLKNLRRTNPQMLKRAVQQYRTGHSINSISKKYHIGKSTLYKNLRKKK